MKSFVLLTLWIRVLDLIKKILRLFSSAVLFWSVAFCLFIIIRYYALGAEEGIIEQLKELEQVVDVFETIGTHDMMVKLQAENFEKIREIVSWNIQKLAKVRSTATLIKKDN